MSRLHVFDMDGTLLHGSACFEISRAIGVLQENIEIEEAWARGDFSDDAYWQRCLPLWQGLTCDHVATAFTDAPWLDGVQQVFADIRARSEFSAVITQSPKFFAERLCAWGVNFAYGAHVTPGKPECERQLVQSEDKLTITRQLLAELEIPVDNCVVYGDSLSDLALFQTLTRTVGVNAKPQIKTLARATYDGPDLWAAYLVGRELIKESRPAETAST